MNSEHVVIYVVEQLCSVGCLCWGSGGQFSAVGGYKKVEDMYMDLPITQGPTQQYTAVINTCTYICPN